MYIFLACSIELQNVSRIIVFITYSSAEFKDVKTFAKIWIGDGTEN